MADDASTEIARNILRNIIPMEQGGMLDKMGQGIDQAGSKAMSVLQQLGLVAPPAQPAPPMNQPLPQVDPKTGQVIYPGRR